MKPIREWTSHPALYRLSQSPFAEAKLAPFWHHNGREIEGDVLDIGCGPGTNAGHFAGTSYLGVDISPEYIADARRDYGDHFAVVDVCNDPIPGPARFDVILANSLFHHIDTPGVRHVLHVLSDRLAAEGSIHILDLVLPPRAGVAGLLARLDRGDYPRPLDEWTSLFEEVFEPVVFEPYALPSRGPTLWNMVYFKGRRRR